MTRKWIAGVAASAAFALSGATNAFATDTSASSDAMALAKALAGPGFNIVDATLTTDTENGFFTDPAGATGIASGVVLTTGVLSCVGNSNTQSGCSGEGKSATLSVNFTLEGSSLFFNYVFGSEEYNSYVNAYNDSFELLLDGKNIAMLPGGGGVVSIDNVNLDVNSKYYRNNNNEATGVTGTTAASLNLPIELDGLTTVLTAEADGIAPGEHNLTFTISDGGDTALDSAVFIQAQSVGNVTPPISGTPEPSIWLMMIAGIGLLGGLLRQRPRDRLIA